MGRKDWQFPTWEARGATEQDALDQAVDHAISYFSTMKAGEAMKE